MATEINGVHMQTERSEARNVKHDETVKLAALAHFASSGSVTATAEATGLPKSTLQTWTSSEEGSELVGHVRTALRHAIAADLVTNARLAVAEVRDRLINGDEVVQSDGSVVRRKVTGKDAMYIASNSISQHAMLTMDSKAVANANLSKLASDLIEALKQPDSMADARVIDVTHTSQVIDSAAEPGKSPVRAGRKGKKKRGAVGGKDGGSEI